MKTFLILILTTATSVASAKKVLSCSLYDLATDQHLEIQEAEIVKNKPTEIQLSYIDVSGYVLDKPVENGLREQTLIAENTIGERTTKVFRYSLKTATPNDFAYVTVEYPGLGDTIILRCFSKDL